MFQNDLIAAYKITKENNGSSVTVDHLANKYLETHSKEEYRKNLKGIGLKAYLVKSDHFAVTQNTVTITGGNHIHIELVIIVFVIGNNTLLSKQDEKMSQSEEQPPIERSSACSKPMNVLVHFECNKAEFSKRIKTNTFDQFYDKVCFYNFFIDSKVPDFKSHCMW